MSKNISDIVASVRVFCYSSITMDAVIIDPKVRFGKPTIAGTRITVEEILGAFEGGMDFDDIQKEYGLTKQQVAAALQYVGGWLRGEETQAYEVLAGR